MNGATAAYKFVEIKHEKKPEDLKAVRKKLSELDSNLSNTGSSAATFYGHYR